ncbi:translocation/assembly module TamB domain-containing protein [Sulfurivermis fontis]|uniref:translocation/assembly module TamB domain-containing protein n=1 Tax=Sulfurivermis fontis TaxID=1972068 RepID=UPI000FD81DF3|nr:translocation/assembly module TamB domain-containing protein [Sulfurivermis fontis]
MRLRRLLWFVLALVLLVASGAAWWLLASEAGLAWAWGRAVAALEGRLAAERVRGRLLGPVQVAGLRLERNGVRLEVDELALDWQPVWLLTGRLALRDVTARGVRVEVMPVDGAPSAPQSVVLPLALSVENALLRELTLRRPQAGPLQANELHLTASWRGTRLRLAPLQLRGPWGELSLDGRLATGPGRTSDLKAQWALALAPERLGLAPGAAVAVKGAGRIDGTFREPHLTLQLETPAAFSASATLAWQEAPLRWQAQFELPPVDPSRLHAGWPAMSLGGQGQVTGSGGGMAVVLEGTAAQAQAGRWAFNGAAGYGAAGLQLERLVLRPLDGAGEVRLQGTWPGGAAAAEVTAQWEGLVHPRLSGWRSSGRLEAAGLPGDYRGRLSLEAVAAGMPPARVSTDFAGDLAGLSFSSLAGQWLAGDWRGEATLGWRDGLAWRGHLRADGIDPGQLDARWSGLFAAEAEVSGHLRDGPQLSVARLELRGGGARFSARGGVGKAWDLRWQLEAADLARLWPQAAGRIALSGRVEGAERTPRLRIEGEGAALRWAGTALAAADVQADIDLAGAHPWRLEARLAGLERGGRQLDTARLQARGSAAQHDIDLSLQGAGNTLAVAAHGRWADGRWEGTLQRARLAAARLGVWQAAPAALHWGSGGGYLQPWCWKGEGEICVGAEGSAGEWQASGALAEVPLALLEPWLPRSDLAVSGRVGGAVVVTGSAGEVRQLIARLGTAEARLRYRLPEGAVETALSTLQLDVDGDAAGLGARLQAAAADGGGELHLSLPGWLPGQALSERQPLRGRLDLAAERLDWLTYLEPNLLRPAGRLEVHLQLAGTLGDPALRGELGLRDGSVLLPAAGTRLTDITLEGRSSDGRSLTLRGSARSGPGQLTVDGLLVADRLDRWRVELGLEGERFELVRLVQGRALVSPDLKVVLEAGGTGQRGVAGQITVTGRLEVPQADINLPRLPTVVDVSPDEVIVDAVEEEAALRRWRLALDLRLVAGERVRLEGYGFSGRLAGAVSLRGETPGLTRAQGELNVHDGRYEAYGQNLVVERGRLLFVDSPPDNPGLDVRAVRPLPEQTQVVGVEVGGRLKDPRLRLFSEPVLEESETLAWLVLGRPLTATSRTEADALYRAAFALGGERAARGIALQFGLDEVTLEQGASSDDASVVLGKYLSPRLYLQYAVGLWETANRLRLRYQLSSHWSLKMEQGAEQSGADLQYVIER